MSSYRFTFGGKTYTVSSMDRDILEDGVCLKVELKEFELAHYLCQNAGRLLTRAAILKDVWGEEYRSEGSGKLDTYATKLRTIYGDSKRSLIHAEKRKGFIFHAEILPENIDSINSGSSEPVAPDSSRVSAIAQESFPAIWNVPFERNIFLKGREKIIQALHSEFSLGRGTQVLLGLSGRGKTQIALEYAYRYRSEYNAIWWVRSRYWEAIEADIAELATELGLNSIESDGAGHAAKEVRKALRTSNLQCLIIFDDALDTGLIQAHLGHGSFRALITTSNINLSSLGRCHEIGDLDPESAIEFLIQRTKEGDRGAAASIAKELGYLPLALEHAAAYIEAVGISLCSYLEKLTKQKKNLKEISALGPLAATWETTLLIVKYQSISVRILITCCSVMAAERIPIFDSRIPLPLGHRLISSLIRPIRWLVLRNLPGELRANRSPRYFDLHEVLLVLRQFSLVQTDGRSFWFHDLVLLAARRLSRPLVLRMCIFFTLMILTEITKDLPKATLSDFIPHYLALIERAKENNASKDLMGELYAATAIIISRVRGLEAAIPYYKKSLFPQSENIDSKDPSH